MPNGVICGGAVEGSNQAGEIVTCQAMTIRPDEAAEAFDAVKPKASSAAQSEVMSAGRSRGTWNEVMDFLEERCS